MRARYSSGGSGKPHTFVFVNMKKSISLFLHYCRGSSSRFRHREEVGGIVMLAIVVINSYGFNNTSEEMLLSPSSSRRIVDGSLMAT